MRDWIPFFVVCALAIALLSFWTGAVTVTGVTAATAPHGIIEYWFNRYQTVIAAFVAFSAALFVSQQIRETRAQHRANVRLAMRKEFDALHSAEQHAEAVIRSANDRNLDVAKALLRSPISRAFPLIDDRRLERILQHTGDVIPSAFNLLRHRISDYDQWRDAGSVVSTTVFGTKTASFAERIDWIVGDAIRVVELAKMRRADLEKYAA